MRRKPFPARRAIIGLATVCLVAWRIWIIPRIDSRLVGRWQCTTFTAERQLVTLYLWGDGRGKYTWQEAGTAHVEDYPWALSGRTLQVGSVVERNRSSGEIERIVDRVIAAVERVIYAFERAKVMASFESWTVLSIARDELCLRQRSDSAVMTFKRIPSGLDLPVVTSREAQ